MMQRPNSKLNFHCQLPITMNQRLTQEELAQVVFELEKMRSRTENELTREEVEDILRELNLSPDLLDDALMQLRRKQALKAEQRRNKLIAVGVVVSLVMIIGFWLFSSQEYKMAIAKVQVQQDRITLGKDKGTNFKVIERRNGAKVVYRVTLKDAPIGKRLDLSCNWINPNGDIIKQNRYQTRNITTSIWNTRCRYTLSSSAPIGNWQVQMLLNDRQLSEADFQVN